MVKKVIEYLHKSPGMRTKFEDLQFEMVGKRLKMVNDMPHRWLGTIRLIHRILSLWDVLRAHYFRVEMDSFPVDRKKKALVELYSLMKPVGDVIVTAQATSYLDAFLALCLLNKNVHCISEPLPIYDPTRKDYSDDSPPHRFEAVENLESITFSTRIYLSDAVSKRFYDGYNGTPRSKTLEMQVFFHPAYRKLKFLKALLGPEVADKLRDDVVEEVVRLVVKVAEKRDEENIHERDEAVSGPPPRRQRLTNSSCRGIWTFDQFEEVEAVCNSFPLLTPESRVRQEVQDYLTNEQCRASSVPTHRLLNWWKKKSSYYPCLSTVSQCVLGHPASSAQVERDFGSAGSLITGTRSCLDSALVDMSMFLYCNFGLIPSKVPEIPASTEWKSKMPKRFTGAEYVGEVALERNRNNTLDFIEELEGGGKSDADDGLSE